MPIRTGCIDRNIRSFIAFPNKNAQAPGEWVESDCIRLTGVTNPIPVHVAYDRGEVSINEGPWQASATLRNNDRVRLRARASTSVDYIRDIYLQADNGIYGIFQFRIANNDRAPRLFQVGPNREYKQLTEVRDLLRAGDVVEVDGDATYNPVEFTRAGMPAQPIWIRGVLRNGKRPIISGGSYGISFRRGHDYVVENFEVTGATSFCLRNEADGIRFINVYVHDCPRHGALGADTGSGTVVFDRVEITRTGAEIPNEALKHGIYVATDYQAYPGSKLKVIHSFIHNNGGNGVKSRAERSEMYFNWVENRSGSGSYYTLEMIGFQEFGDHEGQPSDVVGNVLVHRNGYGIRLGGDGSGESRGRSRVVNNTFVLNENFNEYGPPAIRITSGFEALWLTNNLFASLVTGQPIRLWRHNDAQWVLGTPQATGANNWIPSGGYSTNDYFPTMIRNSVRGNTPPLVNLSSMSQLDVRPADGSNLIGAGAPLASDPGYEINGEQRILWALPPATRPVSGQMLTPQLRDPNATPNIGAL